MTDSETETDTSQAPEVLGVTWEEFLKRCRKGLNYTGDVTAFSGRKLLALGTWLQGIS